MAIKKVTDNVRHEIETRLHAGETRASLCRAFQLNPKTLSRWLERWAEESPAPVRELSAEEIRMAKALLDQGLGVRQVTLQLWKDRKRHRAA